MLKCLSIASVCVYPVIDWPHPVTGAPGTLRRHRAQAVWRHRGGWAQQPITAAAFQLPGEAIVVIIAADRLLINQHKAVLDESNFSSVFPATELRVSSSQYGSSGPPACNDPAPRPLCLLQDHEQVAQLTPRWAVASLCFAVVSYRCSPQLFAVLFHRLAYLQSSIPRDPQHQWPVIHPAGCNGPGPQLPSQSVPSCCSLSYSLLVPGSYLAGII